MSTAGSSLKFLVRLECKHDVELTVAIPGIQTLQFCYSCDTWKPVTAYPAYYRGKCMTDRKCLDRLRADEKAVRRAMETHARNKSEHIAELRWYDTDGKMFVVAKHASGKWNDKPESLAQIAARSQGILRDSRNRAHIALPQIDPYVKSRQSR
jgi:uncharacterized protein YciI